MNAQEIAARIVAAYELGRKRGRRDVEEEMERLRGEIEDYLLWRPGEKGHAAAHRKLADTRTQEQHSSDRRRMYGGL